MSKEDCFGLVYKATNKVDGKVYIGQTIHTLEERKQSHESEAKLKRYNTYFYRAIRKYGKESFSWIRLEYCDSKESLNLADEWYIRCYKTFVDFDGCQGYNLTLGGQNRNNIKRYKNRLCGLCETSFVPTSGNQKYCVECQNQAKKRRDKILWRNRERKICNYKEYVKNCRICGKEFTTYYTKKIYCGSDECEKERCRRKNRRGQVKRDRQRFANIPVPGSIILN